MIPEAMELVETFKPDLFWADGANHENGTDSDYFGSKDFLAWLYNESPIKDNVVVNDRCIKVYFLSINTNLQIKLFAIFHLLMF